MKRVILGGHPCLALGGLFWVLYSTGDIYMITEIASAAGTAVSLPAFGASYSSYYGQWLAPAACGIALALIADDADVRMFRGRHRGLTWTSANLTEGDIYGSKVAFDRSDRTRGWGLDRYWGGPGITDADSATLTVSLPNGYYTLTEMLDYCDYYGDWGLINVYSSSDGGATWSTVTAGSLGRMLPTRVMAKSASVRFARGVEGDPLLPGWDHTLAQWTAAWPSMTASYALAGSFLLSPGTFDGAVPEIAMLQSPSYSNYNGGYWVQDSDALTDYTHMSYGRPWIDNTFLSPIGDGDGCYAVVPCKYLAGSMTSQDGNVIYARAPGQGTVAGETWTGSNIATNFVFRVSGSSASQIQIEASAPAIWAAVDPNNTDNLYLLDGNYHLGLVSWPSTAVADVPFPASYAHTDQAGLAMSSSGTLLICTADSDGAFYSLYRSPDSGSNWSTIDLSAYEPASFSWDDLQIAENVNGMLATPIGGGKLLYSEDNGSTWKATAVILPTGGTICSFEGR